MPCSAGLGLAGLSMKLGLNEITLHRFNKDSFTVTNHYVINIVVC